MRQRLIACGLVGLALLGTASLATETITYKYDAKGRLVEVKRTGTVNNNVKAEYQYDKAHNRTRVIVSGSANLPPP